LEKAIDNNQILKKKLDDIYNRYHRSEFIHPDPLEFLYSYDDNRDREIVGVVASSLAYGRVVQILASVKKVLDVMGPSPYEYVMEAGRDRLMREFRPFKHRFTTGGEMACLLHAVKKILGDSGSLNLAFLENYNEQDENILPAMLAFSQRVNRIAADSCCSLMPSHTGGSAFKRVNLFLRWMVRKDNIDPGGWEGIPASKLLIPLDTHMARISGILGLTGRKQADMKAVLEVTESLKKINDGDPVRYDFSLTRIGINRLKDDLSL